MGDFLKKAGTAVSDSAKKAAEWLKAQKLRTLMCIGVGVLSLVLTAVLMFAIPNSTSKGASIDNPSYLSFDTPDVDEQTGAQDDTAGSRVNEVEPQPTEPPLYIVRGDTDEELIPIVQSRLMSLCYMDTDEPTSLFGPATEEALTLFQKRSDLEANGILTQECYDKLMSSDALKYMATVGDEGTDITEIQYRLRELDYISDVTGYFGSDTLAAVKLFQKNNGLSVDGKVGVETKEALYSSDAKANFYYMGSRSDAVLKYQEILKKLGYLTTKPDGVYGEDTVAAVKRFQERNSLIPDGYLGPQTREVLTSGNAQANALMVGMSGDDVRRVQIILKGLDYLYNSHCTGYFGSVTEVAVREFQRRNSLTVDGKVGKQTMNKLTGTDPKGPGSNYTIGGTGGGSGGGTGSQPSEGPSVSKMIKIARSKKGAKYVLGGKGPNTFDCSGFVYWVLNKTGISQPYLTSRGWRNVTQYQRITSIDKVKAGDVLVFKMSETQGHVGIASSSSMMIDASANRGKVVERTFLTDYWRTYFYVAYRIL